MTTPSTAVASNSNLANAVELAGRLLLVSIFLVSGLSKVGTYAETSGYMAAMGVPGVLLPLVILTEVLGSLAIAIGWKTRHAAFLLAGFTVLSAILFHSNFADQMQAINFMKNFSMTGGFLLLVARGAGALSLDARIGSRKQL
jgi:putative oxidoreductase